MIASLLLALTISAPDDLAGARVTIDGAGVGVLHAAGDGYARLVVNPSPGAHSATIELLHFSPVKKKFHLRADVPQDVRVLRREIVRTSDEGACVCHDDPRIDAVFSGRVIGLGKVIEDGAPIHVITFETTKWWQGNHRHNTQEVRTWEVGSRYCGVSFAMGREYFVRAWGTSLLHTDACARTRPLDEAESEIAWIEHTLAGRESAAKIVSLTEQDAAVLAAIDCSHLRSRRLADSRTTLGVGLDRYEAPEEARAMLEEYGVYDLAEVAPELVTRLIDVNVQQSALIKTDRDVSLSLPAYVGDYAAVNSSSNSMCPGIVFLRRTNDGWQVVNR